MQGIARLVLLVLRGVAAAKVRHQALRRGAIVAAVGLVALFCLTGALGCAVAALWIAAVPVWGPIGGALAAAGALLLIAIIAPTLAMVWSRRARRRAMVKPALPAADIEQILAQCGRLMHEDKMTLLALAAVLGLLFGARAAE